MKAGARFERALAHTAYAASGRRKERAIHCGFAGRLSDLWVVLSRGTPASPLCPGTTGARQILTKSPPRSTCFLARAVADQQRCAETFASHSRQICRVSVTLTRVYCLILPRGGFTAEIAELAERGAPGVAPGLRAFLWVLRVLCGEFSLRPGGRAACHLALTFRWQRLNFQ